MQSASPIATGWYTSSIGTFPADHTIMFRGVRVTPAGLEARPPLQIPPQDLQGIKVGFNSQGPSIITLPQQVPSRAAMHRAGVMVTEAAGFHRDGPHYPVKVVLPAGLERDGLVKQFHSSVDGLGLGALYYADSEGSKVGEDKSSLRYPIYVSAEHLLGADQKTMRRMAATITKEMARVVKLDTAMTRYVDGLDRSDEHRQKRMVRLDLVVDGERARDKKIFEETGQALHDLLTSMKKTPEMRHSFLLGAAAFIGGLVGAHSVGTMILLLAPPSPTSLMGVELSTLAESMTQLGIAALPFLVSSLYHARGIGRNLEIKVWAEGRHVADFERADWVPKIWQDRFGPGLL